MSKEITWITTADIKKKIVDVIRGIYPNYRIYGKPVEDGYEVPSFFIDIRLIDRSDATINIVNKNYRVHIVYFQDDMSIQLAEEDQYNKIEEIANALYSQSGNNRNHNMVVEVNGRHLTVTEFGSEYTGKANNILCIDFTITFYDYKEIKKAEPLMEEFEIKEILKED